MPSQPNNHRLYRAVIRLYPKAHREAYGDLMLQTLDDMLADRPTSQERFGVWLRIVKELPLNVVEEHINNREGRGMSKLTKNKPAMIAGVIIVLALGAMIIGLIANQSNNFTPTTLANVQNKTTSTPCQQMTDNPKLNVSKEQSDFIGNAVATSIIDVPAGTNVDVHLKAFANSQATGTAIYGGKYGTYNFTAAQQVGSSDSFTGGWTITHFEACKA